MRRILRILLFLSFVYPLQLRSQILPGEGSSLNYRIIGFSFPVMKKAVKGHKYKIEIAKGHYNNVDSFQQHIIVSLDSKGDSVIAEVPLFGTQYTWRVIYDDMPAGKTSRQLHHFCTDTLLYIDTLTTRLRIQIPAVKYKDAFVFLDENRALYDMQGRLVWFLPKIDSIDNKAVGIRDIKLSPQGTITCMTTEHNIYEVNYDGAVLWHGPDNTADRKITASYHHEFTKLANGHYMVIGSEFLPWKKNSEGEIIVATPDRRKNDNSARRNVEISTVTEYDKKGKIVWYWSAYKYYLKITALQKSGVVKNKNLHDPLHANAFFFDEKKKALYISFRNTSQVIKVAYPSGKIAAIYSGDSSYSAIADYKTSFFSMQHACKLSQQGNLYLFNNNNDYQGRGCPTAVMMQLPRNSKDRLEKIWEYECPGLPVLEKNTAEKKQTGSRSGGNVTELPDQSVFISSCTPYGDVLIVNRKNEILWSAVAEIWDDVHKTWMPNLLYRASIIPGRDALAHLIWGKTARPSLKGG